MNKILLALCLLMSAPAFARITLTAQNHCYLEGSVNSSNMNELKSCLAKQVYQRKSAKYPIYLVIDSPGGSIYEGLRFIEFAESFKNVETVTIFGASMAAEIVQALPGKRHVTRNSIMMFHRAAGVFRGQFGEGEVEQQLKLWKTIVAKMERKAAKRIGITHARYKKLVKDEWWLYGTDNHIKNTADVVSSFKCSMDLMQKKIKKTEKTFLGSVSWYISACPFMN